VTGAVNVKVAPRDVPRDPVSVPVRDVHDTPSVEYWKSVIRLSSLLMEMLNAEHV
jgi:hypothetical protein